MTLLRRYPVQLFVTLAITLVLVEWFVVHSQAFAWRPDPLALGITVDLLLGLPVLYYFLIVRTGHWSKTSLVAVFGAGLGLATWLLPDHQHTYVNGIAQMLPVLEVGVFGYLLWHGSRLLKTYQAYYQTNPDFTQNVQQSLTDITEQPTLSASLATEATVVRYGLFGWVGRLEIRDHQQPIFSHRDTGQVALLVMVALVAGIESVVVHVLVARWSGLAAWLLTATSAYGLLFIIAEIMTTVKRPSFIADQTLHLRFGIRWRGQISLSNIERVERINETPEKASDLLVGSVLVQPNQLLVLREPVTFEGIYGIKKTVSRVAILVDSTPLPLCLNYDS